MVKAVRQIGDEYGIAMLPSLPTPFSAGTLRDSVAALLPVEPAPSPAVDVAEALKAGWLELWYQQKINVRTLVPSGAEALVRMRHPAWGVVPPAYFIRDDKDPHFRELSEFVIDRAIEDWHYLLEQQGPVDLSINLPVSFLRDRDAVRDMCLECPTHPAFGGLILEINSAEVIANLDLVIDVARQVRLHNIAIAIDNVGAEWPSLMGLHEFPLRRAEGRPSIRHRLRGQSAEANGMPKDRRTGAGQRRARHSPGRRNARRLSRRAWHGFRPCAGLSVQQAAGGKKIRPLPPFAGDCLRPDSIKFIRGTASHWQHRGSTGTLTARNRPRRGRSCQGDRHDGF